MITVIRELKRIISQFFETEYFYRFRFIGKNTRALSYLNSTWEGTTDIFRIMLVKVEHMFYNIKNHNDVAPMYIDPEYFTLSTNISEKDKQFYLSYIKHYYFGSSPHCENTDFFRHRKEHNGNFTNTMFVGHYKKLNYYLVQHGNSNKQTAQNSYWEMYTTESNKMKHLEFVGKASQFDYPYCFEKQFSFLSIRKTLNDNIDIIPVTPADYKNLSDDARSHIRGYRQTLIELLEFRKLLKKAIKLSTSNNVEKQKEIYGKLAEIMASKGNDWWS